MAREFARGLYNSKAWKAMREYIMRRDGYMCQCYKLHGGIEPCGMPAEEVHHIIKLTPRNINNKSIALGENNLISISRDCHQREHKPERVKKNPECDNELVFDKNGMLVKRSEE